VSARLTPAQGRVLYALADAWWPPPGDAAAGRGGGDVDVAPAVADALARLAPGERRALLRWLALVEWLPRATPAGRHGFAWLPRDARARWLAALARSPLPPLRRGAEAWRRILDEACAGRLAAAAHEPAAARCGVDGPSAAGGVQSSPPGA